MMVSSSGIGREPVADNLVTETHSELQPCIHFRLCNSFAVQNPSRRWGLLLNQWRGLRKHVERSQYQAAAFSLEKLWSGLEVGSPVIVRRASSSSTN